jgi:hypothetical protein
MRALLAANNKVLQATEAESLTIAHRFARIPRYALDGQEPLAGELLPWLLPSHRSRPETIIPPFWH